MGDMGTTVLMLVLMGGAFYFLLIRPQQKRAKKQQEMTNALTAGSRVMLSSGVFGTIRHLGERQAIIEIAPGTEMTVAKQAIVKTVTADEDEFEYADDSEPESVEETANPFDTIEPSDITGVASIEVPGQPDATDATIRPETESRAGVDTPAAPSESTSGDDTGQQNDQK